MIKPLLMLCVSGYTVHFYTESVHYIIITVVLFLPHNYNNESYETSV